MQQLRKKKNNIFAKILSMETGKKQWICPEFDDYTIDQTKGGFTPAVREATGSLS